MNDLFSNLAIRNSGLPSPEVLQPRLPTLFDPSGPLDGPSESFPVQAALFSIPAATEKEIEQPISAKPSIQEPSWSGTVSEPEGTTGIQHQRQESRLSRAETVSTSGKATFQPHAQAPSMEIAAESIRPFSTTAASDETLNNLSRSETIMSSAKRISATEDIHETHQEKENIRERVIHPRVESLTAGNVEGNGQSPRPMPGGGETSMKLVLPHEESEQDETTLVRIHIGRIDVRAVPPAPTQPASKPAPAQPRLTLEDYLRQREGHR